MSLIWVLQFSECSEFQTPRKVGWLEIEKEEVVPSAPQLQKEEVDSSLEVTVTFPKDNFCHALWNCVPGWIKKPDRESHCSLMIKRININKSTERQSTQKIRLPSTHCQVLYFWSLQRTVSNLVNYHINLIIVFNYPLVSAILHIS